MSADGKCARLHLSTLAASRGPGGVAGAGVMAMMVLEPNGWGWKLSSVSL